MKDWRHNFNLESIEKGYYLYFNGYVNNIQIHSDKIQAVVGNHKTKVILDNDCVISLHCTCHVNCCEHTAATLIAYEYQDHPFNHHALTTEEIIVQLTSKQKDELLKKVLNQDENFRWQAQKIISPKMQDFPKEEYTLNQLLYQYNYDGAIFNLQLYLHDFFERSKKEEDQYIYILLLNRLKTYPHDKMIQVMIYDVLNSLSNFLKNYSYLQHKFFTFLSKEIDNEIFLDFLFDNFRTEPFLSQKLELINVCLNRLLSYDAWGKTYFLEHYLVKKLQVLYDMKNDEDKSVIYEDYYHLPKVREFYILECIQEGDYLKAIQIINDSKKIDKDQKYLMIQYQNYLIDIYEKIDLTKYREALYEQLFKFDVGSFDIYLRFKEVCPSNIWLTYFYELIDLPMPEERLYDILLEEQEYTQLFKQLLKNRNRYYLEKKKNILISKCPNEFSHIYELLKTYEKKAT